MRESSVRLWPFSPLYALLAAPIVFVALLILLGLARLLFGFPDEPEGGVLSILLLVSLVPIGLLLVDALSSRGGAIEYMGVKLTLAGTAERASPSAVSVPVNIGVPAQPVSDSSTAQILDALRAAVGKEVALVDLESGQAWWETRLLVLIAGAVRHGRPSAIVFLATIGGVPGRFQGWGDPHELLPHLLDADHNYRLCYARAQAAFAQWMMVEPTGSTDMPPAPSWMSGLAAAHPWMGYKPGGPGLPSLPNPLAFEQFLATALGSEIEQQGPPVRVTEVGLRQLFSSVLRAEHIEENRPEEEKAETLLKASGQYVAITRDGVYQRLLAKDVGLSALILSLARTGKERPG